MQAYVLELRVAQGFQLAERVSGGMPAADPLQERLKAAKERLGGQDEEWPPTDFCAVKTTHRFVSFPSMSRREFSARPGGGGVNRRTAGPQPECHSEF